MFIFWNPVHIEIIFFFLVIRNIINFCCHFSHSPSEGTSWVLSSESKETMVLLRTSSEVVKLASMEDLLLDLRIWKPRYPSGWDWVNLFLSVSGVHESVRGTLTFYLTCNQWSSRKSPEWSNGRNVKRELSNPHLTFFLFFHSQSMVDLKRLKPDGPTIKRFFIVVQPFIMSLRRSPFF